MTEILAAILLIAGSAVVLIAAIGVLRLPDSFMRMHAATKAGVVGAGLVLLGTAFAFGSVGAWATVAFALTFLLLTTPIASHLLGRAAYVSGAPLWRGTIADHLEGVLTRRSFDRPAGTALAPLAFSEGSIAMPVVHSLRRAERPDPIRTPTQIRRILAVLPPNESADAVLAHAADMARGHRAALTGLSIVDVGRLADAGPMPVGGGAYARMLAETRLRRCRERTADVLERLEAACRDGGFEAELRHEEGEAALIIEGVAAAHDLVLVPATGSLCEKGQGDPLKAALALLARGVRPVAVAAGPVRPVRRIGFWHDGTARAARTLTWLAQATPWPDATVRLVGCGTDAARMEAVLADAVTLLAAHGRTATSEGVVEAPAAFAQTLGLGRAPEALVIGNAGSLLLPVRLCASAALRAVQHPDRLVVLG